MRLGFEPISKKKHRPETSNITNILFVNSQQGALLTPIKIVSLNGTWRTCFTYPDKKCVLGSIIFFNYYKKLIYARESIYFSPEKQACVSKLYPYSNNKRTRLTGCFTIFTLSWLWRSSVRCVVWVMCMKLILYGLFRSQVVHVFISVFTFIRADI